jgi:hypothetical protein
MPHASGRRGGVVSHADSVSEDRPAGAATRPGRRPPRGHRRSVPRLLGGPMTEPTISNDTREPVGDTRGVGLQAEELIQHAPELAARVVGELLAAPRDVEVGADEHAA